MLSESELLDTEVKFRLEYCPHVVSQLKTFSSSVSSSLHPDSSDAAPDCAPLCLTKRQVEVVPAPSHTPAGPPLGRKGRLANLAATIGSWEDDLSHAHLPGQASAERTHKVTTGAAACSKTPSVAPSLAPSSTNQVGSLGCSPMTRKTIHLIFSRLQQKCLTSTCRPSTPQSSPAEWFHRAPRRPTSLLPDPR